MKYALAFGAIVVVFVFFARREVFPWPYYYDEADYMFAASLGFSNYTDTPSQSLPDFIRTGLTAGGDASQRFVLSAQTRASNDVTFYRHWHGPLYFYWLAALSPLHLQERGTRTLSYVFPLVTGLIIYFGSLWFFAARAASLAALLSTALYLWSYPTVFSNEIAPHQLFVLCVVATLLLLMKWRASGEDTFWYAAVVAGAFAFCTLEVAFVLLFIIVAFSRPRGARARACRVHTRVNTRLSKPALLFLATVLFIWPSAILKLSFVKAYLFMAYLALVRTSPWGSVGFLETWRLRFTQSPGEWLLLAAAIILYFRFCDPATRRALAPVVAYGVLMLVVLLRVNTDTPRYTLPFLPAFELAAGFTFASVLQNWKPVPRFATAAAILLLLFWNTESQIRHHPIRPAPRLADVLSRVREANLDGKKLLAFRNDVPMIHYYLPAVIVTGYTNDQERSVLLAQDSFDAVLNPDYPVDLQRLTPPSPHYFSQR